MKKALAVIVSIIVGIVSYAQKNSSIGVAIHGDALISLGHEDGMQFILMPGYRHKFSKIGYGEQIYIQDNEEQFIANLGIGIPLGNQIYINLAGGGTLQSQQWFFPSGVIAIDGRSIGIQLQTYEGKDKNWYMTPSLMWYPAGWNIAIGVGYQWTATKNQPTVGYVYQINIFEGKLRVRFRSGGSTSSGSPSSGKRKFCL